MKRFRFSVVLYAANEEYEATVRSILSQSVGFAKQIRLLISFGPSVRDRGALEGWITQYPENITLLDPADSLQTAYRSAMARIGSGYLNFAECGAVYDRRLFEAAADAFRAKGRRIRAVVGRCSESGANESVRYFLRSLPENRSTVEWQEQFSLSPVFFPYTFFRYKDAPDFSCRAKNSELFLCRCLIDLFEGQPVFWLTETPMIRAARSKPFFKDLFGEYLSDDAALSSLMEDFLGGLLEKYGDAPFPKYVQYSALSYLEWCATEKAARDPVERVYGFGTFRALLARVLAKIDDSMFFARKNLRLEHRLFLLGVKYGREPDCVLTPSDQVFYYGNTRVFRLSEATTRFDFVELEQDRAKFSLRAKWLGCGKEDFGLFALVNGSEKVPFVRTETSLDSFCCGEAVYPGAVFTLELDLRRFGNLCSFAVYCVQGGCSVRRRRLSFGRFFPLPFPVSEGYYHKDGRLLTYDEETETFRIEAAGRRQIFKRELRYCAALRKLREPHARRAIAVRLLYPLLKRLCPKNIWLISDRPQRADDNGEAFLQYLCALEGPKPRFYFVIDPACEDGKRIAKFAKVIAPGSDRHKLLHLLAEYVISAQVNPTVIDAVRKREYYRDLLYGRKLVFLQHGVINQDLSSTFSRWKKNLYGFVSTTKAECESLRDPCYGYPPENIWLTGLPRFDRLYHREKKQILILPTWRRYLMNPHPDPVTGQWALKKGLTQENAYSAFYNSLLRDERLLRAAKKAGYTICFKPHPLLEPYQQQLFRFDPSVRVLGSDVPYRTVFAESALAVTDYSSAIFDFAYLRKPILYAQFDLPLFYATHPHGQGYFDPVSDGFGEVVYTVEETVDRILAYMQSGCTLEDRYRERIENAFSFRDADCSRRIYEHLIGRSE